MVSSQFFSPLLLSLSLLSSSKSGAIILNSNPASLTILAPRDYAGPPNPVLVGLHLLPVHLTPQSLKSLPFGAMIPTLLHGGASLMVTEAVSLNSVTVPEASLYDDGSLVICGIEKLFFDGGYFEPPGPFNPPYGEASRVLRSKGWFFTMAELLDLQMFRVQVTVFAPDDSVFKPCDDWSQLPSLLHRHVVAGSISSDDLSTLDDGSALQTLLRGYNIIVSQNGSFSEVNGVRVMKPEIYKDDLIVVHGIGEVLEVPRI